MTQLQRTIVNPTTTAHPIGLYSHMLRVKASELLFLAGQVGLDANGKLVGEGDVAAQTGQTFKNIG